MTYQVIYSPEAVEDLERELNSPTGDLAIAARAIEAIEQACQLMTHSPFSCRKAGENAFLRELIISFGGSGYVALFEIRDSEQVIIGAVRHQNESDFH